MRLLERWQAWRAMRRYAPLSTSSSEGSRARVTGIVGVLDETVSALLSGRECVLARARIRGTGHSPVPARLLQIRPFVLVTSMDATVVVDGSAALLGIAAVKLGARDAERKIAFAARFAVKLQQEASFGFEEIVVAAGDRITVGGVVMHDLNPAPPEGERAFRACDSLATTSTRS